MKKLIPLLGIVLTALISHSAAKADTLEKIKTKGELTVACEPGFLPFEMLTQKGEFVGFDIEMMKAFAKHLGVEAKFVSTRWDGIIPGLMTKRYDLIVSGMTITEDRSKTVLFSDPYYTAGLKVLISKKNETSINSLKELDIKGKAIAVKLGTTGDLFASANIKNAQLRKFDNEADAAQSVALGQTDALIYDKPYLEIYQAARSSKLSLLEQTLSDEQFGVAARKKDKALIEAFNVFLKEWKNNKGYDETYKKIFVDMTWKKHFPNMF